MDLTTDKLENRSIDLPPSETGCKPIAEPLKLLNAKILKLLAKQTSPTTLDLSNCNLADQGAQTLAKALEQNSTLRTLNLTDNDIRTKGVEALANALKANTSITTLDLRRNNLYPKGVIALAEALKQNSTLETLDIMGNPLIDDDERVREAFVQALETNTTLTELVIKRRVIKVNDITHQRSTTPIKSKALTKIEEKINDNIKLLNKETANPYKNLIYQFISYLRRF